MKKLHVFLLVLALSPATYAESSSQHTANSLKPITVYKSPSCGCCGLWIDHINQAGFTTRIEHPKDLSVIKDQLGVSPQYQSCHTAVKDGYLFEGHIPADVMQHFLAEKPRDSKGLVVPGMPPGSPGMGASGRFHPYEVLLLSKDGSSTPYARVSFNETTYLEKK